MSDEKTMTPELLPEPKRARGNELPPRQRVQRHMKELLRLSAAASAAVATSCAAYGVVDPIPPPAVCRDNDAGFNFSADAELRSDGTVFLSLHSSLSSPGASMRYAAVPGVDGGQVADHVANEFWLAPTPGATQIALDLAVTCQDNFGASELPRLHVVIHLPASVQRDAGIEDAGAAPDSGDAASGLPLVVDVTVTR